MYCELVKAKESATIICILAERDPKAGRGVGTLYSGKGEGFRCALIAGLGKPEDG